MPLNRKLWREHYASFEGFFCPNCEKNLLIEEQERSFLEEPSHSKNGHSYEWWEPEMIVQRFSKILICSDKKNCGELVTITGSSFIEQGHFSGPDGYEVEYYDVFTPRSMYPPPPIIEIPIDASSELKSTIRNSFGLFWVDRTACLNAIRKSVEIILNEQKIPRTTTNKNKKRVLLSLHTRIDRFREKSENIAEILMALKWLGNEGSHSRVNQPTLESTLDAYEILEHALDEIFSRKRQRLKKKIKNVNKKKGRV